ncbi:hypothetical protein F5883DRAFT_612230 [Diaporthe sp. PMI_573]|nr:hypothetical protein F5883DRAFT_612230 [Diaporthaceae sp. PMI_573]
MPHLPNEILDQIWLERCKLGFEPRALQAKWVNDGRFNVPAFHTAQPQEPMTQLCRGARNVAAHGFYSRICDDPFTGIGGFWWSENDVLYVDRDFYKMLRIDRKSVFMGRDHIMRIAADIRIDDDADAIAKVLLDWFPKLTQIFFLGSARLMPVSHFKQLGLQDELQTESMLSHLFILAQRLTQKSNAIAHCEDRRRVLHGRFFIHFFILERENEPQVPDPRSLPKKDDGSPEVPLTLEEVEDQVAKQSKKSLSYAIQGQPRNIAFPFPGWHAPRRHWHYQQLFT